MTGLDVHIKKSIKRSNFRFRVKPFSILFLLALGFALAQLLPFAGTKASSGKAPSRQHKYERAKLHDEIAVRAAGSGNPWINLANGRDLLTDYNGPVELASSLESKQVAPLGLAAGDFDEDGVPDLVSAYASAGRGILTIHKGNIDSIYPDTPEARARKADGTFTDAPFLSPGQTFELSVSPEFLEVGDFNADGHFDVVVAARGGNALHFIVGDGRMSLREAQTMDLPGTVTALASGEANRADGITDLVVGVTGASGPKLMVFEGPESAIKGDPEVFNLSSEATAIALGYLRQDYTTDIAVGAGRDLMIVHGRDRRLSLDEAARAEVPEAAISTRSFESELTSLAIGDFTGDERFELAVLTEDGTVMLVGERETKSELQRSAVQPEDWNIATLAVGSGKGKIMGSRLSSLSHETILMIDRTGRKLRVWMDDAERRERGDRTLAAISNGPSAPATLEVEGEPVAVLPMRLNMDGLSDLVILRNGMSGPTVVTSAPNSTITVCNPSSDCGSPGCGSLRGAILQANQSPGADMIAFSGSLSGVPIIQPSDRLPTITEAVTLSGTAVGSCSSAATEVSPQAAQAIELDGRGSLSEGFRVSGGGTVLRNFVVNRFGNGFQIFQSRGNFIEGNIIGLRPDGSTTSGNAVGIQLMSGGHTVGGTAAPARNLISSNQNGIIIEGGSATDINVQNNIIGTNAALTQLRGNFQNGVLIRNGASRNTVGGSFAGTDNNIFGSGSDGVQINTAGGNNVQRNNIGQHQGNGVSILSGSGNLVGGTNDIVRNNIFLSNNNGIEINGNTATANLVQGNFIGVLFNTDGTPRANVGNNNHGIAFNGNATGNRVGGASTGSGNIIAFNRGDGVSVISGIRNLFISNRIFSNTGLGIDLGNDGPTANDLRDADDGPNTLLNFPELTSASIVDSLAPNGSNLSPTETLSTIRITGVMRGAPNKEHFLQFYATDNCTVSSAQGSQQFLNSLPFLVLTDAQGNGPFDFTLNNVTITGGFVNALAMDAENNTSEFSLCFPVTDGSCAVTCNATVPGAAQVGSAVSFAANATLTGCQGTAAYDWDFGDNTPRSSEQNTTHTYAQAGTYTWRLTVSVAGGAPCTRQGTIIVSAGPVIANAVRSGKKLIVTGAGFVAGAELRINGAKQKKVVFDSSTQITGKKSGKKVKENDIIVVINPGNVSSNEHVYKP